MTPQQPRRFAFGHDPLPPRTVEEPSRTTLPLPSRTTLPIPETAAFSGPSWLARTTLPPAIDAARRPVLPFRSPLAPLAIQAPPITAPVVARPRRASRRALVTAALAAAFVVLYAVGLGAFVASRRAALDVVSAGPRG